MGCSICSKPGPGRIYSRSVRDTLLGFGDDPVLPLLFPRTFLFLDLPPLDSFPDPSLSLSLSLCEAALPSLHGERLRKAR
eukprot:141714-Prymnesium_polylepis.1